MSTVHSQCSNSLPTVKVAGSDTRDWGSLASGHALDRHRRSMGVNDGSKALESFPVSRISDAVGDHANGVSTMQQLDDPTESPSDPERRCCGQRWLCCVGLVPVCRVAPPPDTSPKDLAMVLSRKVVRPHICCPTITVACPVWIKVRNPASVAVQRERSELWKR
jgi:hypothetical protein